MQPPRSVYRRAPEWRHYLELWAPGWHYTYLLHCILERSAWQEDDYEFHSGPLIDLIYTATPFWRMSAWYIRSATQMFQKFNNKWNHTMPVSLAVTFKVVLLGNGKHCHGERSSPSSAISCDDIRKEVWVILILLLKFPAN